MPDFPERDRLIVMLSSYNRAIFRRMIYIHRAYLRQSITFIYYTYR